MAPSARSTFQHGLQGRAQPSPTAPVHGLHPCPQSRTHLPSTASTSRTLISCAHSAQSMRSRRSCRRFRLIMKTCGTEPLSDPPAPSSPPFALPTPEGLAHLVEAHLVRHLGRHRDKPGGLCWGVLHCGAERSQGVAWVMGCGGGGAFQPLPIAPSASPPWLHISLRLENCLPRPQP